MIYMITATALNPRRTTKGYEGISPNDLILLILLILSKMTLTFSASLR